MINYSPSPRSSYSRVVRGQSYGSASSVLLDTPAMWNLAYLSHDYDARVEHLDPQFTTHVRRTTQSRLDGSGVDLTRTEGPDLLASLLELPAPRFVYLIKQHPVLPQLPLFKAYGQQWLSVIEQRSRICVADNHQDQLPSAKDEEHLYHTVLAIIAKAKSGT